MGGLISDIGSTLGDVMGDLTGANRTAAAQGQAAAAQLAQQQSDRKQALGFSDSPEELARLQDAVNLNKQDIQRQQKILDSTDPAVIEAGRQALQMMKGVESGTLAPIRNQRALERQQLQQKLLKQLGPGYENSTAGIQALSMFDKATNDSLQTAQQNAINSYLGTSQGFSAQGLSNQVGQAGSLSQLYGNIANRKVSAINGTPINAGLQFAGDIASGQAQQQSFGQFMQLAGTAAGAMAGGPAGAQAGSTAGSSFQPTNSGNNPANYTLSSNKQNPWSFQ